MPVPNIGKRRVLLKKYSEPVFDGKYYPTEDVKKPAKRALKPGVAKLRASITPGTVLILLSGKYRGKRVIFLKQLESGLLLVTGPFSVNKVPLRRVNQAYVIATSTKVDVSKVDVSAATDKLLAAKEERAEKAKALRGKGEEAFLELQKTAGKKDASEERKALQAKVDAAIKLDATMTKYLQSRFALSKGQAPHNMVF